MPVTIERRTFLTMAAVLVSGIRAHAGEDLTGIWSAESRTRGGLGQQMIVTTSELTSTFGALVDVKYKIDGNLFTMIAPGQPSPAELVGQPFTIEGETLTIAQGPAVPLVMKRVGAAHAGAHPIVGDWSYRHQTGAPAVQRFSRSGAMQLAVVMNTSTGPYSVSGDTMKVRLNGRPATVLMIKREGNVLITTTLEGAVRRFVKFEY